MARRRIVICHCDDRHLQIVLASDYAFGMYRMRYLVVDFDHGHQRYARDDDQQHIAIAHTRHWRHQRHLYYIPNPRRAPKGQRQDESHCRWRLSHGARLAPDDVDDQHRIRIPTRRKSKNSQRIWLHYGTRRDVYLRRHYLFHAPSFIAHQSRASTKKRRRIRWR